MRVNPVRKSVLSQISGNYVKVDEWDPNAFAFCDGELEVGQVYHAQRNIEIMDPTTGAIIHTVPKGTFEVKASRNGTSLLRRLRIDHIADTELKAAA